MSQSSLIMSKNSFCELTFAPKTKYVVFLQNVFKTYARDIPILQNYSMNVEVGQIYGLLGSSGCGKSTVLSCILGLRKCDSGSIIVFGQDVRTSASTSNIGYMPQDHALYNELTVREIIQFYAKLYHLSHTKLKERMAVIESLLKLDGFERRRIGTLSGGQNRRISLALSMMHDPKLLILDEPTVGLDPLLREKIWDYLFKMATEQKTTIIITTHYIEEVKHAHMVGIMRRGTLLVEDDPSSLMKAHDTTLLEDVVLKICKIDSLRNKETAVVTLKGNKRITNENINRNDLIGHGTRNLTGMNNKSLEEVLTKSFQRICAYTQVIWINFLRQPIFIILLILLPPMQILTAGSVFGTPPLSNALGVVNKEVINGRGNCSYISDTTCNLKLLSCVLVNYLNSSSFLETIEFNTDGKARMAVERGDIMGYLEIPDNYSSHTVDRAMISMHAENTTIDGTIVSLNLDMSNNIIAYSVIDAIHDSFAKFVKEISTVCNIDLRRFDVPFFFRKPVYGHKDATVTEYMLSSLVICVIFEVTFVAAPLVLINDLDARIFERSRVAGLKLWEMMSGILLAMSSITVIQAIVCFVSVECILGFHSEGTIWAFTLLCLVTAFCNSALGLMIGIWLKDTVAIILTAIFLFPVLGIHSGIFQVLEVVPDPFRTFIFYGIPNVSITKPLRWIMNRGASLTHSMVWPGVLVTVGWGVAFTIVCAFLLRRM